MVKLSDAFLHILGNALQGDEGTPAAQEGRQIRLAQNARANIDTQTGLANSFNAVAPGTPTVNPQGSFQVDPNSASLTGLTPGTTYQPISKTMTTPIVSPGKTPGSSTLSYSSRPVNRGETVEPTINTLSPYAALLGHQMGFNKDLFDKYDSDMHTNLTALQQASSGLPKGYGQSVVDAISSGLGVPAEITQSPEYQAKSALIQKFAQGYNEAKMNRDNVLKGMNQGGAPAGGSGSAPTAQRPPPPSAAAHPPLGQVAAFNKVSNQWVFVPQANAQNSAIYDPYTPPQ